MHRRALLEWLVATGGLLVFNRLSARDLEALGADTHRRVAERAGPPGVLTAAELAAVAAIAECIIPRTETPGATDAGVASFIDVMLGEWYDEPTLVAVRSGVAQLGAFANATEAEQVARVETLDRELAALRTTTPAAANDHWFGVIKYLTVWGYCTSEPAMRELFHSYPAPMTYNGAAPLR